MLPTNRKRKSQETGSFQKEISSIYMIKDNTAAEIILKNEPHV